MNYYTKMSTTCTMALNPYGTYYKDVNGLEKYNFPTQSIYVLLEENDIYKVEDLYIYKSSTGAYVPWSSAKEFNSWNESEDKTFPKDYIICKKVDYILIPAFCESVYEYKGYQQISRIQKGVQYYTREDSLIQNGENAGKIEYTYFPSFKLFEEKYYYNDEKGEYEVEIFQKGGTYYTKNKDTNAHENIITIPKENFFIKDGYVETKLDNPLSGTDVCYYQNHAGKNVFIEKKGYMIAGLQNFVYHNVNEELEEDTFSQGKHYVYDTVTEQFIEKSILKNFSIARSYYIANTSQYDLVKAYDNSITYYLKIDTDYGSEYVPWSSIFDFSNNYFQLYLLDSNDSETGLSGLIGDSKTEVRKFQPVNRGNAIYDSKLTYYAQSSENGHLYPLPLGVTEITYPQIPFTLYKKTTGIKYTFLKHLDYLNGVTITLNEKDNGCKDTIILKQQYSKSEKYDPKTYWTYQVEDPETLNFWFDFLDTEGDLSRYSNQMIGNRPKAENDTQVKAIYYRDTPKVIFVDSNITANEMQQLKIDKPGYTIVKLTESDENLFTLSQCGKSAQDKLDELLYNNTYCTESVNITTIPVYHLIPNTRIFIKDSKTGINGEYIISKITIPLAYNGTMNISAVKAVERIY